MFKPFRLALAASTALVAVSPAYAQDTGGGANDIVVTARRVEERLQDVPISITVFNQQQLANKNVTSATDLATYTPSLSSNNNFGGDNTTFAIRGFVQDIGTAPSVGTYFGDVVTPRGASNGQPTGDGANAGDFFDLQNVQVLKGPQGTLQGRNTTGGAVMFVPQKPTSKLEGYIEGGYGNYDMQRLQGVLNIPINDTFKVRLGFDHMKRDGYLNNVSGIGPKHYGDVDYWAGRVSVVANLTPTLENYIIASFSNSQNNGGVSKLAAADATQGLFGPFAAAQLARQAGDFYNVDVPIADAGLQTREWQIINSTTWLASDTVTVKNIVSYAELRQTGRNPIFGNDFQVPVGGTVYDTNFEMSNAPTNGYIAAESTFTEEFRLNGTAAGNHLNWQAGAYYEDAAPLSSLTSTGSQSPGFASCPGNNFATGFNCTSPFAGLLGLPGGIGNVNLTTGRTSFRDVGLYAQATYKFTDKLSLTGGFRYTWDSEKIDTVQRNYNLLAAPNYGTFPAPHDYTCLQSVIATYPACEAHFSTSSNAPTWLIDLDYNPIRDVLLYAKYSRGYRMGVIVPVIPVVQNPDGSLNTTVNYPKPEKVDAYEIGAKTSWRGAVRGSFNVAAFYNKFSNQQLQIGFLPSNPASGLPSNSAPVNAGKSTIYGVEVEATLTPVHGLDFSLGYTYLHTKIDAVLPIPEVPGYDTSASFNVGDPLALSPTSKLTAGLNYTLPLDESLGKLSIGGSVTYRTSMLTNYIDRKNPNPAIATLSHVPALTLVNANVNWNNVARLPIDLAFFVTNLTDEHYYAYTPGLGSPALGFENATLGEPRMLGGSIKYHF
jgi:iron complex outermembrane receptor protein